MKKINIAKFFRYSMSAFPQIIILTLNYTSFLPFQFKLERYNFILLFVPLLFSAFVSVYIKIHKKDKIYKKRL